MEQSLGYFFLVIFGLLAVAAVAMRLLGGFKNKTLNKDMYAARWQSIEQQSRDGSSGRQLAVVSADKLLDQAMRELNFKGKTMGERLKGHRNSFSDNNGIWEAHKLRNRIAHETDVYVDDALVKRALAHIKRGLQDIGALER